MASEVFIAKESGVNPINALRGGAERMTADEFRSNLKDIGWKVRKTRLYMRASKEVEDETITIDYILHNGIVSIEEKSEKREMSYYLDGLKKGNPVEVAKTIESQVRNGTSKLQKQIRSAQNRQKKDTSNGVYNVSVRDNSGNWVNVSVKAENSDIMYDKLRNRGYDTSIILYK